MKKYFVIISLIIFGLAGLGQGVKAATPDTVPVSKYYGRFVVTEQKVDPAAWYINPVDKRRYYFDNEYIGYEKAKLMMLGITNKDLFKIPLPGEKMTGNLKLRRRLSGRFLLQVENLGRIWYINPIDLKRYYMDGPHSVRYLIDHTGVNAEDKTLVRFNVGNNVYIASVPDNIASNLVSGCSLNANLCQTTEACIRNICINKSLLTYNTTNNYYSYFNTVGSNTNQTQVGCAFNTTSCGSNFACIENVCTLKSGCDYNNPSCGSGYACQNNACAQNQITPSGCFYNNPACGTGYSCQNNVCVEQVPTWSLDNCESGALVCGGNASCQNNSCVSKLGCNFGNPSCFEWQMCGNGSCQQNIFAAGPNEQVQSVIGTRNLLTIFWNPNDGRSLPSKSAVEQAFFGTSPSMSDYFKEISMGKLTLYNAGTRGWYNAQKSWSHYANETPADDPQDRDQDGFINGETEIMKEALTDADATVDFKLYDTNQINNHLEGNELTVVVVIPGPAASGDNKLLATNMTVVASDVANGQPFYLDGVVVNRVIAVYVGSNVNWTEVAREVAKVALNLPADFARYGGSDNAYTLMSARPLPGAHLDPWSKLKLGWLKSRALDQSAWSGYYALRATSASNEGIILYNQDRGASEYFILENRYNLGAYDKNLPQEGLVIWHITPAGASLVKPAGGYAWNDVTSNGQPVRLVWSNGANSVFTIAKIPPASATMNIFIRIAP